MLQLRAEIASSIADMLYGINKFEEAEVGLGGGGIRIAGADSDGMRDGMLALRCDLRGMLAMCTLHRYLTCVIACTGLACRRA